MAKNIYERKVQKHWIFPIWLTEHLHSYQMWFIFRLVNYFIFTRVEIRALEQMSIEPALFSALLFVALKISFSTPIFSESALTFSQVNENEHMRWRSWKRWSHLKWLWKWKTQVWKKNLERVASLLLQFVIAIDGRSEMKNRSISSDHGID